mmetsp:Transcript_1126/g.3182  ORF Transcript_1126/g.3182 Transcript_1126/m.3182 type:complete len:202 (-) Transcript_1126:93-698(-)
MLDLPLVVRKGLPLMRYSYLDPPERFRPAVWPVRLYFRVASRFRCLRDGSTAILLAEEELADLLRRNFGSICSCEAVSGVAVIIVGDSFLAWMAFFVFIFTSCLSTLVCAVFAFTPSLPLPLPSSASSASSVFFSSSFFFAFGKMLPDGNGNRMDSPTFKFTPTDGSSTDGSSKSTPAVAPASSAMLPNIFHASILRPSTY